MIIITLTSSPWSKSSHEVCILSFLKFLFMYNSVLRNNFDFACFLWTFWFLFHNNQVKSLTFLKMVAFQRHRWWELVQVLQHRKPCHRKPDGEWTELKSSFCALSHSSWKRYLIKSNKTSLCLSNYSILLIS